MADHRPAWFDGRWILGLAGVSLPLMAGLITSAESTKPATNTPIATSGARQV
jgi:hypothetical protein